MSALPPEIVVSESPGGVRYRLPRRPLPLLRYLGLLLVGFGLALACVPLLFVLFFSTAGRLHQGRTDLFGLIAPLVCFGPIFFPLGAFLVARGLIVLAGHAEAAVRGGRLHLTDRWGLLGWTRRVDLHQISGFRVVHGEQTLPDTERGAGQPGEWANLLADLSPGKAVTVVWWYPREWLLALADELALRCHQVPVADVSADPLLIQQRPVQPTDSDAIFESRPDGLTITFPPAGLRTANDRWLLTWCVLWNGFILVFSLFFLPAAFLGQVKWENGPQTVSPLFACLFLTPFWAVGVGSVVYLLQRARWRAWFSVSGPCLELSEGGIFGLRRYRWAVANLTDIRVISDPRPEGEGGTRWEFALALQGKDDELYRLLSHRPKAELEWVATVVRRAIGMGPAGTQPPEAASEGIQKPATDLQTPGG